MSLEIMPVRLAVYQRESRPLDGLCAQLQCAGYDISERYTETAVLELINQIDVDALLLDAEAEKTAPLIEGIEASPTASGLPIMLIGHEHSPVIDQMAEESCIDDVIILPILRDDLRSRIRNMARLASMKVELERRLKTFSDFGISRLVYQSEAATNEQSKILLIGPMGDEQISLIDLLGDLATFTYATTTACAWQQLCQSDIDAIMVSNKVASDEFRGLCRQIRTTARLRDLPVLAFDGSNESKEIETIFREMNFDLIRAPFHPIVTRKRLQAIIHRHRLKNRLRGLMANGLYVSTVDHLTGLYGRGFLYCYLDQSIRESRTRGASLSVATCRASGLAKVNATLGYPAGDQLIGQLGRALADSCRAQDLVARVRGASFSIVLNDTSENEARAVCERVANILEEIANQSRDNRFSHAHLTISLAEMVAGDQAETLINRAFQQPATVALQKAS